MSRWYRAYEGTVTDAKLGEAALIAGCSRSVAIAAWHCILESCATAQRGGEYDTNPRRVAVILSEPLAAIDALFAAFTEIGMLENGSVTAWKQRQFESDTSTERSRKHRATKRNGDATLQQRDATPPETETETYTEKRREETRATSEGLEAKLREAAGWQSEPHPGLFVTGPIEALIASGADLELDVLPVIRGRAAKVRRPAGWNYFIGPIQDAVEARRTASTGPPTKAGNSINGAPQKSFEELRKELLPGWTPGTKYASSTA